MRMRGCAMSLLVDSNRALPRTDLGGTSAAAHDNLDALVERIVDEFPPLAPDQKAELGRLLSSGS